MPAHLRTHPMNCALPKINCNQPRISGVLISQLLKLIWKQGRPPQPVLTRKKLRTLERPRVFNVRTYEGETKPFVQQRRPPTNLSVKWPSFGQRWRRNNGPGSWLNETQAPRMISFAKNELRSLNFEMNSKPSELRARQQRLSSRVWKVRNRPKLIVLKPNVGHRNGAPPKLT